MDLRLNYLKKKKSLMFGYFFVVAHFRTLCKLISRFFPIAAQEDQEALNSVELKLIQSKNDIENPPEVLLCQTHSHTAR